MLRRHSTKALVALVTAAPVLDAAALWHDQISPFVSEVVTQDDNVFRLADGVNPAVGYWRAVGKGRVSRDVGGSRVRRAGGRATVGGRARAEPLPLRSFRRARLQRLRRTRRLAVARRPAVQRRRRARPQRGAGIFVERAERRAQHDSEHDQDGALVCDGDLRTRIALAIPRGCTRCVPTQPGDPVSAERSRRAQHGAHDRLRHEANDPNRRHRPECRWPAAEPGAAGQCASQTTPTSSRVSPRSSSGSPAPIPSSRLGPAPPAATTT